MRFLIKGEGSVIYEFNSTDNKDCTLKGSTFNKDSWCNEALKSLVDIKDTGSGLVVQYLKDGYGERKKIQLDYGSAYDIYLTLKSFYECVEGNETEFLEIKES